VIIALVSLRSIGKHWLERICSKLLDPRLDVYHLLLIARPWKM
jgi:hypothetical protein